MQNANGALMLVTACTSVPKSSKIVIQESTIPTPVNISLIHKYAKKSILPTLTFFFSHLNYHDYENYVHRLHCYQAPHINV